MMIVKKTQVVLISLAILIAVAGYLNWSYQKDKGAVQTINDNVNIEESTAKNLGEAKLVDNEPKPDNKEVSNPNVKATDENSYFVTARIDKEKSRSEALDIIKSIIDNSNSPKESKANAQNEMVAIGKAIEQEGIIENLIRAKGFSDVVVFINHGSVSVVIKTDGLSPAKVAQINDIIVTQTGIGIDKIKINEIK